MKRRSEPEPDAMSNATTPRELRASYLEARQLLREGDHSWCEGPPPLPLGEMSSTVNEEVFQAGLM